MDNRRVDQKCHICNGDIFSINTRRIGDKMVCIECLNVMQQLIGTVMNDLADRAQNYFQQTNTRPDAKIQEFWAFDFGIQLGP